MMNMDKRSEPNTNWYEKCVLISHMRKRKNIFDEPNRKITTEKMENDLVFAFEEKYLRKLYKSNLIKTKRKFIRVLCWCDRDADIIVEINGTIHEGESHSYGNSVCKLY